MTSRERILAAFRRQKTDYAPCMPMFWASPVVPGYSWASEAERLEVTVERLGVDAIVYFGVPYGRHPDVVERAWREDASAGRSLLHKRIDTPAGPLTCTVRLTDDWPHGDDIPLFSDFVVSRIEKPWIETEADLDRLEYVWLPPAERTDEELCAEMAPVRALAQTQEVAVGGVAGFGLTTALSLCGAEQAAMLSADQPGLLERLAEIEHRATMGRIEQLSRAGVDFLTRNGFYETTDFWSPAFIRRALAPRLERELALAHSFDKPVTYTVCTGVMPIIDHLKALEFDCLFSIEPVLGDQDMTAIARELGRDKCIWGGLSAPIHMGQGTPEGVREAVRDFYATFGRRGTILAAVPSIRPQWPWENVVAMVEEWKTLR